MVAPSYPIHLPRPCRTGAARRAYPSAFHERLELCCGSTLYPTLLGEFDWNARKLTYFEMLMLPQCKIRVCKRTIRTISTFQDPDLPYMGEDRFSVLHGFLCLQAVGDACASTIAMLT